MEALREYAVEQYWKESEQSDKQYWKESEQSEPNPSPQLNPYHISVFSENEQCPLRQSEICDEEYLLQDLERLYNEHTGPSITVVYIAAKRPTEFSLSQPAFCRLLDLFNINKAVLLHLKSILTYDFITVGPKENETCIVYVWPYALMWKFDWSTRRTWAIMLAYGSDRVERGLPKRFRSTLNSLGRPLSSPAILPYVCLADFLDVTGLDNVKADIIRLENSLDYGGTTMWVKKEVKIRDFDRNQLDYASKMIGLCRFLLVGDRTKCLNAISLAQLLQQPGRWSSHLTPECDEKLKEIRELSRSHESYFRHLEASVPFLQARLDSLSTFVFHLMTHKDAMESIQLAKASTELAEAARRDSSSMKTIAVMTMVFLPATFFASLFALPTLKWDEERIISDKFWLYLVFTLPVTAAVFLVWGILNHENPVRQWLRLRCGLEPVQKGNHHDEKHDNEKHQNEGQMAQSNVAVSGRNSTTMQNRTSWQLGARLALKPSTKRSLELEGGV